MSTPTKYWSFLAAFSVVCLLSGAMVAAYSPAGQTHTATATPASPTISIPAYTGSAPLNTVTVTVTSTLVRTYQAAEFSGEAPGVVAFNAQDSNQGHLLLSPLGGFLCSGRASVPETILSMPPGGSVGPLSDLPLTWTSTQTTAVNPAEFSGPGPVMMTMEYPSRYIVVHQSGSTRARQSSAITSNVTFTYN